MKLFNFEKYTVTIDPETLLLKPFKKLWDKYENKEEAMQTFGFIYFFCDPRSDYMMFPDEETRLDEIKKGQGLPEKFKITKEIREAIDFYSGFKPASIQVLESTKRIADKLRVELEQYDISQEPDKIDAMTKLATLLGKMPNLIKSINEAEKDINTEMQAAGGTVRGSREKTVLEDGFSDF